MLISDLNHLESVEASKVQGGLSLSNNFTSIFSTNSSIVENELFNTTVNVKVDIGNTATASGNTASEAQSDAGNNVASKQESFFLTLEQGGVTATKSQGIGFSAIQ
ncbi:MULTISPECIES: hypothetical protein [unclassified Moorena]|uniref:hypothetical protein n=2 Tax=Moorena TaxID=1155738 RepID=UPI0013FE83E8|nr:MULTISPECIES: hypothetical protein [unclassified Moorena]NEO13383.1 hypothetical protein [Moorena sp. SIO3E8]NEP99674.1 hypothetical protein [Moorena sp. SIO3F7]